MENGLPICASAVESDDMVVFSLLWIDHVAAHSNHQLKRFFFSFHRPRFVRFVIATLRSMVLTTYGKILRDEAENKHFREGATNIWSWSSKFKKLTILFDVKTAFLIFSLFSPYFGGYIPVSKPFLGFGIGLRN